MADLSPIHEGLGPVPCGKYPRLSQLFSFVRVDRHFSESMVLASLSAPSLELVHLSEWTATSLKGCSWFRPVSDIFSHCSHLRGSSHLGSTRTLVPRTALPTL
jgi:hypothetical protein